MYNTSFSDLGILSSSARPVQNIEVIRIRNILKREEQKRKKRIDLYIEKTEMLAQKMQNTVTYYNKNGVGEHCTYNLFSKYA